MGPQDGFIPDIHIFSYRGSHDSRFAIGRISFQDRDGFGVFTNIVAIPVAAFALVPSAFIASFAALFSQCLAAAIWHVVAIPAEVLLFISNFSAEHGSWGL